MGLGRLNFKINGFKNAPYLFLFLFPFLPRALQSIVFIFFLVSCFLIKYFIRSFRFDKLNYKLVCFLTVYYFFFLITYLYSTSYALSFEYIQPTLLLLFVPLILIVTKWKKEESIDTFAMLLFTVSTLGLFYLLYQFWTDGLEMSYRYYKADINFGDYNKISNWKYVFSQNAEFLNGVSDWGYYKHGQSKELNTHHSFLAATYNFNIILLLSFISKKRNILQRSVSFLFLILLAYIVWFLQSKVNIFCLLVLVFVTSFYVLVKFKSLILRYTLLCLLLVFIVFNKNYLISKYSSFNLTKLASLVEPQRKKLYTAIINEVKKYPISGRGANNVGHLVENLSKSDTSNYYYHFNVLSYLKNPHSQYLFYLLSGGFIQLGLFLLMLGYLLYVFLRSKNMFAIFFIFLIGFNCLFEDFLNRTWGVYLFCLGLIYFWNDIVKKENEVCV